MNLTSLKEQLLALGAKIGLKVYEETANYITLHSEITAQDYFDNSIYCHITVFEGGTFHFYMTFDEIEKTYDNLFLINNFNVEHPWFQAYITNLNGKDFFELHHAAIALKDEKAVTDIVGYLLNDVLNEDTLALIKPILANAKAN